MRASNRWRAFSLTGHEREPEAVGCIFGTLRQDWFKDESPYCAQTVKFGGW